MLTGPGGASTPALYLTQLVEGQAASLRHRGHCICLPLAGQEDLSPEDAATHVAFFSLTIGSVLPCGCPLLCPRAPQSLPEHPWGPGTDHMGCVFLDLTGWPRVACPSCPRRSGGKSWNWGLLAFSVPGKGWEQGTDVPLCHLLPGPQAAYFGAHHLSSFGEQIKLCPCSALL